MGRILVLGGTGVTGSAVTSEAVARGHEVTVVHRGEQDPDGETLPTGVEHVIFDRLKGHQLLAGRSFDAVLDLSCFVPGVLQNALATIGTPTTTWVYFSSTSAHADTATPGQSESAPLAQIEDADVRRRAMDDPQFDWRESGTYGACKVLCEEALATAAIGRWCVLRPCVIAGPRDTTGRFDYWVARALRGGSIVAPEPRTAPVGVVDARDLAAFALECAERAELSGPYIVAPDPAEATFEALVEGARAAASAVDSTVVWVPEETLLAHDVEPWSALPFWLPDSTGFGGFNAWNATRARAAGLVTRPLAETALHVREWLEQSGTGQHPNADHLSPEAEAAIVSQIEGGSDSRA